MDLPATFRCSRQDMTLTVPGCRALWLAAQERRPEPWESRYRCLTCPIGAGHAGVAPAAQAAKILADSLRCICSRCQRTAERGDRREPLVNGQLCVSCDNRDREAVRGRNCKGNPPRLVAQLHAQTLAAGGAVMVFPRVVNRAEAILRAARQIAATGQIVIGRPAMPAWNIPHPAAWHVPARYQYPLGLLAFRASRPPRAWKRLPKTDAAAALQIEFIL